MQRSVYYSIKHVISEGRRVALTVGRKSILNAVAEVLFMTLPVERIYCKEKIKTTFVNIFNDLMLACFFC